MKKKKSGRSYPVGHVFSVELDPTLKGKLAAVVASIDPPLPIVTSLQDFLGDLEFAAVSYRSDQLADKTRLAGIYEGLWSIRTGEGYSSHNWAAKVWLDLFGGKKKSVELALDALRESKSQGRPPEYAKKMLAGSICNALNTHTRGVVISSSRDNGDALTKDGVLATLFQGTLEIIDGRPLADPFPYLKAAVNALESQ
jgi:hypothetical protein